MYFPCSYYWCKSCLRNECTSINWNKDEYSHRFYADTLCYIQTHYITCYVGKISSNISSDCKSNLFLFRIYLYIHLEALTKFEFLILINNFGLSASFLREIEINYTVFLFSRLSIFVYLTVAFARVVLYVLLRPHDNNVFRNSISAATSFFFAKCSIENSLVFFSSVCSRTPK